MANGAWGVDISHSSIKAVNLRLGPEGIELADLKIIDYAVEPDRGPSESDELIKTGMSSFKSTAKLGGTTVACSLPIHASFCRQIKVAPGEMDKGTDVINLLAQQNIPFPLDEVVWDFQFIDREYKPEEEREYILYAVKKEIVQKFLDNAAESKFNVDILQFAPVALYNFILYQSYAPSIVALDFGANNTELLIIEDKKVWLRNLPISGNDLTKDIQAAFKVGFLEAEALKVTTDPDKIKEVYKAILPELKNLAIEVNKSIGWYKSVNKSANFDKVILSGKATLTHGFTHFVHQNLQLSPVKLDKIDTILVSEGVDKELLDKNLPGLGVAIGLALQGLGISENKVNLVPKDILNKRKVMKKIPFIGVVALMMAVAVYTSYNTIQAEIARINAENKRTDDVVDKIDSFKTMLDKSRKDVQPILQELSHLSSIGSNRKTIVDAMDAVNSIGLDYGSDAVRKLVDRMVLAAPSIRDDQDRKNRLQAALSQHLAEVMSVTEQMAPQIQTKKTKTFTDLNAALDALDVKLDESVKMIIGPGAEYDAVIALKVVDGRKVRYWEILADFTDVWILDARYYEVSPTPLAEPEVLRVAVLCAIEERGGAVDALNFLKTVFVEKAVSRMVQLHGLNVRPDASQVTPYKENEMGLDGAEPDKGIGIGMKSSKQFFKFTVVFDIQLASANGNGGK